MEEPAIETQDIDTQEPESEEPEVRSQKDHNLPSKEADVNRRYVTPQGVQQHCPDCGVELAKPNSIPETKIATLCMHRGTETCVKMRRAVDAIISRRESRDVGTTTLARAVEFLSPTPNLRVWLRHPITRPNPLDGRRDLIDPGLEVVFQEGRFATDDPEVVAMLRRSPSNAKVKEQGGQPVMLCKDRFYERGYEAA